MKKTIASVRVCRHVCAPNVSNGYLCLVRLQIIILLLCIFWNFRSIRKAINIRIYWILEQKTTRSWYSLNKTLDSIIFSVFRVPFIK